MRARPTHGSGPGTACCAMNLMELVGSCGRSDTFATRREHRARKKLDRELAFFRKNRRRMRYAELADEAMGIGSGVVEAAD